jgi:hypothetical protein
MTKLATFALIAAGFIAISAALVSQSQAQEATPQPMQCNGPNILGGQTIAILDHATVTPPEGYYYNWSILPPGGGPASFSVCIVGTPARVLIYIADCTERSRVNPSNDPTLNARLDSIVASCSPALPRTELPNSCVGQPRLGGRTIEIANSVALTPPGGGSYVIGTLPPSFRALLFCYVEGNATVTISHMDCAEVRRENPSNSATADYYLDLVVASCVKLVQPTIPPEHLIPIEPPANQITPPDTGDAGQRP